MLIMRLEKQLLSLTVKSFWWINILFFQRQILLLQSKKGQGWPIPVMSNPSLLLILRKKIMMLMFNSEHNFPMTEKQQDLRMCKPTNGKVEFLRCDTQVINSEGLLLKHDILPKPKIKLTKRPER